MTTLGFVIASKELTIYSDDFYPRIPVQAEGLFHGGMQ